MNIVLRDFVTTIEEGEAEGSGGPAFWDAHDSLGHYLGWPLDPEMMEATIKPFLEKWNSYRTPIDWEHWANIWNKDIQRTARSLAEERIEDTSDAVLDEAGRLYETLTEEVSGIGKTNASKVLSLGLTELCVMWDGEIRKRLHPVSYREFLKRSCRQANDLIQQCMCQDDTCRADALIWLREIPLRAPNSFSRRAKPLAKLLDQYNYPRPDKTGPDRDRNVHRAD
jgi:hypothetical protein